MPPRPMSRVRVKRRAIVAPGKRASPELEDRAPPVFEAVRFASPDGAPAGFELGPGDWSDSDIEAAINYIRSLTNTKDNYTKN